MNKVRCYVCYAVDTLNAAIRLLIGGIESNSMSRISRMRNVFLLGTSSTRINRAYRLALEMLSAFSSDIKKVIERDVTVNCDLISRDQIARRRSVDQRPLES